MIAQVLIRSSVKNLNKTFDYLVPKNLEKDINVGSLVFVQFGNKKSLEEAIVVEIKEKSDFENKLKEISKIEEKEALSVQNIELAKWMAKRYFCNISDCLKLMLPPGTTAVNIQNRVKEKTQNVVDIQKTEEEIENDIEGKILKSDKQIRTLRFILENGEVSVPELEMFVDSSRAVVQSLIKKGYLKTISKTVERNPFFGKNIERTKKLSLNEEQKLAFENVAKSINNNKYNKFLLYGVTGSGKTEVYLQLIEEVLNKGKSSILLVPEISLTPQTVNRFLARFGEENIAVLHSKLSIGERFDQWKKIKENKAKIVIGARSAIFAPIHNLGLIIIDEEHDDSYKSEMTPKYDAKEISNFLAQKNNIPLVLGSATPDLKTYYEAEEDKIEKLVLTKRANEAQMPEVKIVDLREELALGNHSMISNCLYEKMKKNLETKKQTILFLNRRGFSTCIMCRDCGYTVKCKRCNITMTYHKTENILKCHYCGYEENAVTICPECKSTNIRYFGTGTQKLEEEVKRLFPDASTIRMDVDTVNKKNSHEVILGKFRDEGIDILIGTQMVVKGHHFPNVTLVGVISADGSLNSSDFRANERTFQILTQVAGRAGRGQDKGEVIIQTYNPDSFAILTAKDQNYEEFYDTEIMLRKQLKYPPFCDIIVIAINSKEKRNVQAISNFLHQYLKKRVIDEKFGVLLYSPVPAPIDRIQNRYRWRILIKCKTDDRIVNLLNDMSNLFYKDSKISKLGKISIDLNPNNMN